MARSLFCALFAAAATYVAGTVHGQNAFPAKPVRVIVPYSAGGVVDVQTRAVTQRMGVELGQPMVVEARPGAGGNIAAAFVAGAAADGYTLLVSAPFIINNPLLEDNLRWRPDQLVPVGRFALSPSYFVVPANSSAQTVAEFITMAKNATQPLQHGGGGWGSTQSMSTEMFKIAANIRMDNVPYNGAPPMVPDLINGALAMAILPSTVAMPHMRSGALRALANISATRSVQFPDVPTIAELGFPAATALSWYGFHVPAGTPAEVVRTLDDALQKATAADQTKERLVNAGGEPAYMNTTDFTTFLETEAVHWKQVVVSVSANSKD